MSPTLPETIEHNTGSNPQWSILWLHGLGADGHDFMPIVPELVRPTWPALRFVFPHAPLRAVTINNRMRMRAWYDIREADLSQRADEQGLAESVAQINALIAREAERGVPPSRIVLVGFSQGGAVTLATGLQRKEPLAGLAGLSTYLPAAHAARMMLVPGAERQPVFIGHGQHDPIVPLAGGEHAASVLRQLGFTVNVHHYPMQHSVCAEEITDLGHWMQARWTTG